MTGANAEKIEALSAQTRAKLESLTLAGKDIIINGGIIAIDPIKKPHTPAKKKY
jgi:hypothetical protein